MTLTDHSPKVFVVTATHNRCEKTLRFIEQYRNLSYRNKELVIVDDGSTDGTAEGIEDQFPEIILLRGDGNLWWSGATNRGITFALEHHADYILTINDDSTFGPDLLGCLVETASCDTRYIVGSRLMNADEPGRVRAIGTTAAFKGFLLYELNYLDAFWDAISSHLSDPWPVDTLCGNGVLLPAAVFRDIGLFDADAMPQYHADSDLVMRARSAGYVPVVSLKSVIHDHIHEQTPSGSIWKLMCDRRSDRYLPATWKTIRRYSPMWKRWLLLLGQYLPYLPPKPIRDWLRERRREARKSRYLNR